MEFTKRTLGDICDEVRGIVQTGPFGSQLHKSDYKDEGIPVVMPKNIIDDKVSIEEIARIGKEDVERLSQHKLQKGDIVYGRRGDIGRRALTREEQTGWLCGTGCIKISLQNSSILEPSFLYYYLGQPEIVSWIYNQAIGATMPNLNTSIIRSIPITYPPLTAQRKITSILSNYDNLIENNTRRIEILEQMAKLIYEEWFVKFRFPGHENVKMVSSELGEIPEGWEVKAFSEVIDVNPPRRISKGKLATKVSMADLNTWQSWINSWQKEEYKSGPKFKNGDTLFARITPSLENGKTAFVNILSEEETAFGSTEFIVFGPKVIESGPYIFCLSRSEYVRETAITAMTGTSGRQRVPNDCFDHLLICVPPTNIVGRFNEIVVPLFEMIKNNSKKSLC
jgi:type I restriction enzyme, S subunit